jgi:hypothetical protein
MKGNGSSRYRRVAEHEYDDAAFVHAGFERAWETELGREDEMSRDALVEYLMRHSERIAAVRDGLAAESEQHTGSRPKTSRPSSKHANSERRA